MATIDTTLENKSPREEKGPASNRLAEEDAGRAGSSTLVIGKTSATERDANSSDHFNFWLAPDQIVNPFDIVQVDHVGLALDKDGKATNASSRSYGLVTTIEHRTDSPNHLANFISSNFGDVNETNVNTPRVGSNVAKVNILANNGEIYMPVQNDRPVTFASPEGIQEALGIDTMTEANRIPAGLIKMSNGASTVAYLDQEFILGPEGAHINISGISGLATKTSFAMFMLQSILQKAEKTNDAAGQALSDRIAVIILNVNRATYSRLIKGPTRRLALIKWKCGKPWAWSHDPLETCAIFCREAIRRARPTVSDESFGEAVLPRRARGDGRVADAHGSQSVPDGSAVDLIPICGSGSAGPHSKGMPP